MPHQVRGVGRRDDPTLSQEQGCSRGVQDSGPTFYQLHLLFAKHYAEQSTLVDAVAERIQLLGGVRVAMARDVADTTLIPRPPKGRESVPVQLSRLLHAHEIVLKEARTMARRASEREDDGTNDLLVSNVIRTNELDVWFIVRTHRHVFAGGHRPCTGHESCHTGDEDLMSRRRCRRDSDDKTRG